MTFTAEPNSHRPQTERKGVAHLFACHCNIQENQRVQETLAVFLLLITRSSCCTGDSSARWKDLCWETPIFFSKTAPLSGVCPQGALLPEQQHSSQWGTDGHPTGLHPLLHLLSLAECRGLQYEHPHARPPHQLLSGHSFSGSEGCWAAREAHFRTRCGLLANGYTGEPLAAYSDSCQQEEGKTGTVQFCWPLKPHLHRCEQCESRCSRW